MANMAPTPIEAWLLELKTRRSFHHCDIDPSNPYSKALSTFQAFTDSVIAGLERKDPEVVSLIAEKHLKKVYSRTVRSFDFSEQEMKWWVKEAMIRHPLRRQEYHYMFLAIVRVQESTEITSVKGKTVAAISDYEEWLERVYDPENLVSDPDAMWFLRNNNGIETVDSGSTPAFDDACLICTEDFDQESHLARRAPCGYIICGDCFDQWLLKCPGTYTCPLCRACVVCGANNCKHHKAHGEPTTPVPMPRALDTMVPEKAGQLLHGIKPRIYFKLREQTRQDRVFISWFTWLMLPLAQDEPVYAQLDEGLSEASDRVCKAIHAALDDSAKI